MSSMSLTLDLVGALALGFFIGFAYTKLRLAEKFEKEIRTLKDLVNIKDSEYIGLKKEFRDSHRNNIHLNAKVIELEKSLEKKIKQYNSLKSSVISLKNTIKEKNQVIKELENLVLDIQNDYTQLENELNKNKEMYKQEIEKLTEKANDLYMIKGTEELKSAKDVFNSLREKALNKL